MVRTIAALTLVVPVVCLGQAEIEETTTETTASGTALGAEPQVELKPRLELNVPSVEALVNAVGRSHSGVFVGTLARTVREVASASAEGVDAEAADALLSQIAEWPDTSLSALSYAPDTEGRLRWAIRLDWPVRDLHERLQMLLDSKPAKELFEGLELSGTTEEGYTVALRDSTLARLVPVDESRSCLASHADLPILREQGVGIPETDDAEPPLVTCRLSLTGTEKDTGATFLSSFSAITGIGYSARADESGDWSEAIYVDWPPVSGMAAKAVFGRVKQTFYVPDEAFLAVSIKAAMAPGILDQIAGFGQQVVMESPGQMSIVGEAAPGPLTSCAEPQICVAVLPGTGFLPMPDIVVQARTKRPEKLISKVREAAQKANEALREREQPEPWHEATVRDRPVFWSDGTSRYPGVIMPLVMRPVLFTTDEVDARGNERDFVVLGWTSTSPEQFARRWLDLPRTANRRYVPQKRKTDGQLWVNWKQVYKWFSPYVNAPLGILVGEVPLPSMEDVESSMTDALATAKLSYKGLTVKHTGPVPLGVVLVPTLVRSSLAPDEGGDSDLARERLACQRLKVFYHHARLFKKDVGRWPAEVAELDGYVDFAGHPELLKLQLSSRKSWGEWFKGIFGDEDEEEAEADESPFGEIDDDLYVIEWGRESWKLKLAPQTLEHLEELYIDQDGRIHRKEKVTTNEKGDSGISDRGASGQEHAVASILVRAAKNVEVRYSQQSRSSETKKE